MSIFFNLASSCYLSLVGLAHLFFETKWSDIVTAITDKWGFSDELESLYDIIGYPRFWDYTVADLFFGVGLGILAFYLVYKFLRSFIK